MNILRLLLAIAALALAGCVTSHYYNTRVVGIEDPPAFVSTVDAYLRKEGLAPYEDLYPREKFPYLYNGEHPEEKRWQKDFRFTWPEQAGFVAVTLGKKDGAVELSIGSSGNRVTEAGELAGALKEWLRAQYPAATVTQGKVKFVDLR